MSELDRIASDARKATPQVERLLRTLRQQPSRRPQPPGQQSLALRLRTLGMTR